MPLLRGIARTAAIAGTATAGVRPGAARRQQNRWAQQEDQQYAGAAGRRHLPRPRRRRGTPSHSSKDLAELKSQGILSDAEFEAQKAKILAGS